VHHDDFVTFSSGVTLAERQLGDRWLLRLSGELDLAGVSAIKARFARCREARPRAVDVDLEGVTFVDVIGARAVTDGVGALRRIGVHTEVVGVRPRVQFMLDFVAPRMPVTVT
jgi:anti-anti-sigma factor